MVDNICQLTFKFKYHDKNCICIFIKLWCLICLVSTTNYSILQKKVLLKLWVNGNSTSVHYVNIANKRGCVHLKIVFPRRSAAKHIQKIKLFVRCLTHLTSMFHFYVSWKRRSGGITLPSILTNFWLTNFSPIFHIYTPWNMPIHIMLSPIARAVCHMKANLSNASKYCMLCVNQGKNFEPLVLIRLTHLAKLARLKF